MPTRPWWETAVIYQIYPRSFQDTDADGVGDLRGITRRVPYLVDLGIDAIWISPIFASPMADFGYDISNYLDIDPTFGTLQDFDAMLGEAHRCGLKVLLDFVPNHTSDQHPWFGESRSSRINVKSDWYIWREPASDGGVPNNWLSEFGGTAWELEPRRGQYYYHAFLKQQPDLNWRNPRVRNAMYDVMRFWLRRGVDGFRIDVLWHLIKDDQFRDNPPNPAFIPGRPPHERLVPLYTTDRPEMGDVVAEMRRVVDEFDQRVLIGEIYLPMERLVTYYGADLRGVHLPFNFFLLNAPWRAESIIDLIRDYERALPRGGWPNWVLGNHDCPRVAGRVGPEQARIAAMLLLTLRGTPTIYFGDEIGMIQVAVPSERLRDPFAKNLPGLAVGRDGSRTPMQWDGSRFAGFSEVEPWLPLASNFRQANVAAQACDRTSMHSLYRHLIALRRSRPVLSTAMYGRLHAAGDVLLCERAQLLIALNMGHERNVVELADDHHGGTLLLSSYLDREAEKIDATLELRPDEGVVIDFGAT
jgi:alpha-glucosidase